MEGMRHVRKIREEEMWTGRQGPAIPFSGLKAPSAYFPLFLMAWPPTPHPPHTYRIAHALLVGDDDGNVFVFRRGVAHLVLQAAHTEGVNGRGGSSKDSQAQKGRRNLTEHD
jgi:hypothetical protein